MIRSPESLIVAAGSVVYSQGEKAGCAFLLLRGTVELRGKQAGRSHCHCIRSAGEMFGDLALIDDSPRIATAVALEECELLAITVEHLADRVLEADPLLQICIGAIASRYSETVAHLRRPVPKPRAHVLPVWTAHSATARNVISFEQRLRSGIENNEFDVFFQPIVHLASGQLAGFEALMRWRHPERGLLTPADFIPLAEASGLICDITALCLRRVGEHLPRIHAATAANTAVAPRPFVSVNVSGIDLLQPAFAATTVSTLCDAGVDPASIRLEVTESILMQDAERCARTLENCRDQGIGIAIDDFGTGYSSLHYLNTLPISALKMDQSFCRSLLTDTAGRKIIAAILHLGRELGLAVTAEGVEQPAQRDLLAAMGCEFGQGYLFGAAINLRGTLDLVRNWALPGSRPDRSATPAA